nr:FAD-binding oxidoreductase [Rhodococcus sp. (in: high G+C Gram-positive bacteria)]
MTWNSWGTPDKHRPLSEGTRALLNSALGIADTEAEVRSSTPPRLEGSVLSIQRRTALADIVGESHVVTDDAVRTLHLGGKSTFDLLARRSGEVQDAPDAVVFPADTDEVHELLRYCSAESIAVVPFGGGTSVVGGVDPVREWFDAVVSISTARLTGMTHLDEISRTATFGAGVTGPQAEEMLARHGLTLGHFPQSFMFATIGGFAATRSSGQASSGYGRFADMVCSLVVATPIGITHAGTAPASAAGPDLRHVFLGSEGTLGIITSVTVRVHPIPETTAYRAWWFPSFASGAEAFRELAAEAGRPTVMRLSDEVETGINEALAGQSDDTVPPGGCLSVATFEGTEHEVDARATAADAMIAMHSGISIDPGRARAWESGRFDSPYLRDALLDAGALAETLETATQWSHLAAVREAVTSALVRSLTEVGTPPIVMCHISHVYPTGASLYFTVVCAATEDARTQWLGAKRSATQAMTDSGATVTHHHAVGRDHRPWMVQEVGPVGTALLRAIKVAMDPAGVLNPGKLIP